MRCRFCRAPALLTVRFYSQQLKLPRANTCRRDATAQHGVLRYFSSENSDARHADVTRVLAIPQYHAMPRCRREDTPRSDDADIDFLAAAEGFDDTPLEDGHAI